LSDQAEILLSHDHRKRSKLHYEKLLTKAVELPNFRKKRQTVTEHLIQRGRQRFEMQKMKDFQASLDQ